MGCCHNVETTNTIVYIKNDSSFTNTESLSNNNYNAEINWNIPLTLSQKEILRNTFKSMINSMNRLKIFGHV